MMSTEYNLCPKCGGVTSLKRPEHSMRVSTGVFRPCTCKPEPVQKHDGKLDKRAVHDDYHATATIQDDYGLCDGSKLVEVAGGRGDCENSRVLLEPAQALSLLAWLTQERGELQRLAKEQEQ